MATFTFPIASFGTSGSATGAGEQDAIAAIELIGETYDASQGYLAGWLRIRDADTFIATPRSIAPVGFFDWRITYRPQYAHTGSTSDHNLVWFDDDNRLYWDDTAKTIVLRIAGDEIATGALTFPTDKSLALEVVHSDTGRRIKVTGAATGDSEATGDALDAITLPYVAYVFGSPDAEEVAELDIFAPQLITFAQFADDRALVQMDDAVGNRNLRDLLRVLAVGSGRFYDVALTVIAAHEIHSAIGVQLDAIGANVGLQREGFTDARYRVFLQIQTDLLLAQACVTSQWTGTCENIIRITRTFAGVAATITFTNYPPYSYLIEVEGLVLSEAGLLGRFLTTANYAAVYGVLVVALDDDSVWDSNVSPIATALEWESNVVPLANAAIWSIVVVT